VNTLNSVITKKRTSAMEAQAVFGQSRSRRVCPVSSPAACAHGDRRSSAAGCAHKAVQELRASIGTDAAT